MDPNYFSNSQYFDNSQEYPNSQFENSQFFPQINEEPTSENIQASQKVSRTEKWDSKEDIVLMSAWCIASEDPTRGKNQKRASLWARVAKLYDEARAENEGIGMRNENQMRGRWKRLNENASKWVGAYREAHRKKRSGMSTKDVEREAHAIYEAGGSKFNDSNVFNEVMCKHPKWDLQLARDATRSRPEEEDGADESGGSTKRSRTSEEGDNVVYSNQESPIGEGSTIHRPIGRDAAKKKGKGKASQSSPISNDYIAEMRSMRITRESELELMNKRLELDQQKEAKRDERKNLEMHRNILSNLFAKEHLTPADEVMKQRLIAMLYGDA